jgi:hypothetical protein
VISVATAEGFTDLHEFAYQISGLEAREVYVRVSAINSKGQSFATHAWPINDTMCDTMPVHCGVTPVDQLLFVPISPYVQLSYQEVANRLEVSWQQPTHDQFGFITTTNGAHTPSMATHYRVEWSTKADFQNSTWYDIRMLKEDNVAVDCFENCSRTIGEEVQRVSVASGNGEVFDGGEFALVYVGKHTNHILLQARHGSADVSVLDFNGTLATGDFLRIAGSVFQIISEDGSGNVTLNEPFMGGVTNAYEAFHAPAPTTCLAYNALYSEVDTYLEDMFQSTYPLYNDIFDVTREDQTYGFDWIVTFQREMFFDEVEELLILSNSDSSFSHPCTDLTTNSAVTTLGQTYVDTVADATSLAHGEAVFVRVIAINSEGEGPGNTCEVSADGYLGALVPRSPPGLPIGVQVWAVPSSDGSVLKVTWSEGETYGNAITKYSIEWAEDESSTWVVFDLESSEFGGNKTFEYLINVTAGTVYTVRVRQHNDQGPSGPAWFQFIGSHDTTEVRMVIDFNDGAQRCTPTCYSGLDECAEENGWQILARGLPGQSPLLVPNYPQVDTTRPFTLNSAFIYFDEPVNTNGQRIDKWRVEWDTKSSFNDPETLQTAETSDPYYNIENLDMGTWYYIRVVAHHSGGFGAPSMSYPMKPHQTPDAPYNPTLETAADADSLVQYARSLNVSWNYPIVDETDLVGDSGDAVTEYMIEWSKIPFESATPQIMEISIPCVNTSEYQTFQLSLTTVNAHDEHHDEVHYHLGQSPITGKYVSSDIHVDSSAAEVEQILENMPNVADVQVLLIAP